MSSPSPYPSRTRKEQLASSASSEKESNVIASLSAVVQDLDIAELRIFLRRFDGVDVELEAHRFATTVGNETRPLRAFENWLARAKPAAAVHSAHAGKGGGGRALSEDEIQARLRRIRRTIEGAELFGDRFLDPEEVEQNMAFFENHLRTRR